VHEDVVGEVRVDRHEVAGRAGEGDSPSVGRDRRGRARGRRCAPLESTLTRAVVPACVSRTNTSITWLLSEATRLLERLSKATRRPSAETLGRKQIWFASTPAGPTLARTTTPLTPSRT